MFTSHFSMTTQPFSERINTSLIMKDERFTQGLARLQYLLHSGSIAVLYGQTGVGKSTLLKLFLSQIPQNLFLPIYLHFTHLKSSSLLSLIVSQLGEIPKHTKDRLFLQIMDKSLRSNLTPIIVIDEAHLLKTDAITDLRLLVSSPLDSSTHLKIILSGQEHLKYILKRDIHADFAQRISVHYHIHPLTKTQTAAYIDFHLKSSGASDKIFDSDVKDLIHEFSAGIPRQINAISTACLINASIRQSQKITQDIFHQALAEIQSF
ncbi:putative general secretion pathway protein A (ExeA) [Candidatus Kuenenia stuttgartiensis]|uniref:Putative general secretion pathway protein A (ExeA) n=1 Tax=Kuenenia stuttgartiensis TaxID=174633 RepID=Q1Q2U8_KUEST|nr:AAA family ATPase [Candidatus Kuenenia stuttgartiensis]MBW7848809.1 AAA family ATPase [Bacteroidales bacterium]GJQ24896.1 MAG: ATPase [Candidatus Brocadia sapporoensis]QII11440.1 putative general secretion pathway protein A (ExeA) [Candidatus Kuenenia stuttgartiensis]QII11534.1 putative general secretion pathway protein A (ExeA) [Candidatus Kuenenia stuttgartiensis]QII11965.1 putative general secretion pathway protein A (ExeA) [Candidatus Kuenenia stuttgartiensis]